MRRTHHLLFAGGLLVVLVSTDPGPANAENVGSCWVGNVA